MGQMVCFVWGIIGGLASVSAQQPSYEQPPINYFKTEVNDPVARLAKQMELGLVELEYDSTFGYLPSLLKALEVPVSSQTLVFSKTSLQIRRISPGRPRALYFNDDVYVGYCQRGDVIEVAATDPQQGAIFYSLKQDKDDPPEFLRDRGTCLSCHVSHRTQDVPGYLMRSVFPGRGGQPHFSKGTFNTDSSSPFDERWGGWYVTGTHGEMRHMGNTTLKSSKDEFDFDAGANVTDLSDRFRVSKYLSPHSDITALMVLQHQTQMHNALASANFQTRRALHQSSQMNELLERPEGFVSETAHRSMESAVRRVVRYLLMCDEFPLTDQVKGSSSFREEFEARGIRDSQGRSLRDLNLKTRLFEYPCSFLIHSQAFDALPEEIKGPVGQRVLEILKHGDDSPEFSHLTAKSRKQVLEILRQTKPSLFEAG